MIKIAEVRKRLPIISESLVKMLQEDALDIVAGGEFLIEPVVSLRFKSREAGLDYGTGFTVTLSLTFQDRDPNDAD